jgi:hypothetical protein
VSMNLHHQKTSLPTGCTTLQLPGDLMNSPRTSSQQRWKR